MMFNILPNSADLIWILSGPEYDVSGENKTRIVYGLKLAKTLHAKYFIYNGVAEQNASLKKFIQNKSLLKNTKLIIFPCSKGRLGSTMMQFKTFVHKKLWKPSQKLVIVSSWYHLLRAKLLARKFGFRQNCFLVGPAGESINWLKIPLELMKIIQQALV